MAQTNPFLAYWEGLLSGSVQPTPSPPLTPVTAVPQFGTPNIGTGPAPPRGRVPTFGTPFETGSGLEPVGKSLSRMSAAERAAAQSADFASRASRASQYAPKSFGQAALKFAGPAIAGYEAAMLHEAAVPAGREWWMENVSGPVLDALGLTLPEAPEAAQGGRAQAAAGQPPQQTPVQQATQAATTNNLTHLLPKPFVGPTQEQNTDLYGELFSQLPIQEQVRLRTKRQDRAAPPPDMSSGAVKARLGYKGPDRVTGSARPDSFSTGVRRGRDLAKSVGQDPGSLYGGQGKLKPASFGKGTVTNLISNDIVPNHPEARREYYQQKAATEQAIADAATAAQNREYTTETPLEERAETAARVEALKRPPDYRVLQINEIRTMLIPKLKQALDAGDDKLTAAVIQEYLDRISNIGSNQGYFPGSFPEPTS